MNTDFFAVARRRRLLALQALDCRQLDLPGLDHPLVLHAGWRKSPANVHKFPVFPNRPTGLSRRIGRAS